MPPPPRLLLLPMVLALLAACEVRHPAASRDSLQGPGSALVITEATVVAFQLPAVDTLHEGEEQGGLEDFRSYTALVTPLLEEDGLAFRATHADSIVVELPGGPRRVIMLGGLDYPYGYVLVEPGYAETILTGVTTDSELLDEVEWYFGTGEDDGESDRDRQVTRAVPGASYRLATSFRTRSTSVRGE